MHVTWLSAHGALTHFPVAMLIAMFVFDIGSAVFGKSEWKVVSFWLLVTAVIAAVPSLITGLVTANTLFDGSLPPIAALHRTLAITTSVFAVILLFWRMRARDRMAPVPAIAALVLSLVVAGLISAVGYLGGEMALGGATTSSAPAPTPAAQSTETPAAPSTPSVSTALPPGVTSAEMVSKGKTLYDQNRCANCHQISGAGGAGGPDLTHEGARQPDLNWQVAHLKNPQATSPNSFMPKFARLGDDNLKALAAYIVSNK